jgi:hypothetical protein
LERLRKCRKVFDSSNWVNLGNIVADMSNLLFWSLVLRNAEAGGAQGLPRGIATFAPPFGADDVPNEVALLLPNRDSLGLTRQALESDPDAVGGLAVGLFLANPFLDPAMETKHLRRLGVAWIANLPSVEQQDTEFTQQLDDVGLDRSLEFARLAAFRKADFGVIAVVADGEGARLALAADPAALFVMPRVADFAAGFPSFRQRGAMAAEVRRALGDTNWRGPIFGLGTADEAGHAGVWPDALDGLILRPTTV